MAQESNEVGRETAPSATTGDIREQIEQTRAEMSLTIDAIQERLSPGRLVNDAKESVKEATVGRVRRLAAATNDTFGNGASASVRAKRVVDAVKANPMPFAMVGAAAMALIARAAMRSHNGSVRRSSPGAPPVAKKRHRMSTGLPRNTRRLLVGACGAGVGCWSAWRAISAGRQDPVARVDLHHKVL